MNKIFLLIPLLLVGCKSKNDFNDNGKGCSTNSFPDKLTSSFNFSFNWGINGGCYYSSSSKLLTKKFHGNEEKYKTTLELDNSQREFVFKTIKDLDIESYCDDYDYCSNSNKYVVPFETYILEITSDNYHKKVAVDNSCELNNINEKNTKLYFTFKTLSNFLTSTSEWLSLPELDFGYL